jgi:multidrug resistance efflux pump
MDLILMLTYGAIVTVLFKVLRLPVTKWSVSTAALGGVFMMAWMYISMAFFHPFTPYARTYFLTSPISAEVKGKVTEVFAKEDQPLKKGDPLFQIDPIPFQAKVDKLKADLKLAHRRLEEATELFEKKAGRKYDVEMRASNAAALEAELVEAEFDLESTTVRAPADGHVAQNRVRAGITAGTFRISSLMTYVIEEDSYFIAAFRPNSIQNIKVGAEAEVMFTSIPGRVFKAKVVKLWKEIAEGQLFPKGTTMVSVSDKLPPGRIPVQIELLDDISGYYVPNGISAGVAVYSEHLAFLGELRRVLLHMFSWQNVISFDEPGDVGE